MIKFKLHEHLKPKDAPRNNETDTRPTRYQLAKTTGVAAHQIGKIADNQSISISLEVLEKLYKALNLTSWDQLLEKPSDQ